MRKITITKDLLKSYPYASWLMGFINTCIKPKDTDEEIMLKLEDYLDSCYQESTDIYIKLLLLGKCWIPTPEFFDDWSKEEIKELNRRIDVIDDMTYLSAANARCKNVEGYDKRDFILFGDVVNLGKYSGGIRKFRNLDVDRLKLLVEEGFAVLDDKHNEAPSIGEFIKFMEKYPEVLAHGYAVSPERDDVRISIEGLESNEELSEECLNSIKGFADYCDEFYYDSEGLWVWYD